jgi:hypothetical protein
MTFRWAAPSGDLPRPGPLSHGPGTPGGAPPGCGATTTRFTAFTTYCTHVGCAVRWEEGAQLFMCPCHGGAFHANGTVASGSPSASPRPVPIRVNDGPGRDPGGGDAELRRRRDREGPLRRAGSWIYDRAGLEPLVRFLKEYKVPPELGRSPEEGVVLRVRAGLVFVFLAQVVTGSGWP